MKIWLMSLVGVFAIAVCGLLVWLGSAPQQTKDASAIATLAQQSLTSKTAQASAQQETATSMGAVMIQPFSSAQERDKTVAERKAVLPLFMKASSETIARVEKELAQAKEMHAAATEIAAKQAHLAHLKELQQQVLARNADIVS